MTTRNHGNNNYRHCRFFAIIFFGFLIPSILSAQEQLTFVAERDTVAYGDGDGNEWVIRAGEEITAAAVIWGRTNVNSDEHHFVIRINKPGGVYWTFAKHFRPVNTEDLFGDDIFIDYPVDIWRWLSLFFSITIGDVDEMWVPYYYREVLAGLNRDRLFQIVPRLSILNFSEDGRRFYWYEQDDANISFGRSMFYNSAIMLGWDIIAVRNIRRTDFGYMVDGVLTWRGVEIFPENAYWNTHRVGDSVTLFLHLDGDYLDIYVNSHDTLLGTFMRVGREFIAQYQSLIRTNTADLTNVQWPSRADGSTGVRPRPEPDLAQPVVEDDVEEPAEIPATDTASDIPGQEIVVAQDITDTTPPLPWALPAVIAGAVIIVVGVALAVAKRKRKREEPS